MTRTSKRGVPASNFFKRDWLQRHGLDGELQAAGLLALMIVASPAHVRTDRGWEVASVIEYATDVLADAGLDEPIDVEEWATAMPLLLQTPWARMLREIERERGTEAALEAMIESAIRPFSGAMELAAA